MMFVVKLWLLWHGALALVALARRAPAGWWIRCGAMPARVWLWTHVWTGVVRADGWVGYYWAAAPRRLFIALCPYLVLRLTLKRDHPEKALAAVWRGLEEGKRARNLTAPQLAEELLQEAGLEFAIGTRADAVIEEAADRLRALAAAKEQRGGTS